MCFEIMDIHQTLEIMCNRSPVEWGTVSFFYALLLDRVNENTHHIRQEWEKELAIELSGESWEECLHECSINARHSVI